MVNFNDPTLTAAVNAFTAEFTGHDELIRYGQFYLTNRLIDEVLGQIESIIMSSITAQLFPVESRNAVNYFKAKMSGSADAINANELLTMIETLHLPAELRALFTPGPPVEQEIRTLHDQVWGSDAIGSGPPWLGSHPTLQKIQAAAKLEKDRCFAVARALSRKLLHKRGVMALPPAAKISEGNIAGAAPLDRVPAAGDQSSQQVIRYANATGLVSVYHRMRAVIDQRGLVQCGVLSGANHAGHRYGDPEHYVVAFSYGKLSGQDVFLVWDPDAVRSNIQGTSWGRGIGCLFARPDSFSTAVDDADLTAIDRQQGPPPSRTFGDHRNSPIRHCYQVYYVQTLPV